ncbi:hydrolase [Frondihabitans sp. PAMC 28766]|uniref:CocE/NonD family hydrolase n=1 Tax=Frondihabitans sp. PAMC 28766 TaxID=1795630 RepID=UPI00078EBA70|nr:CocE/NonD family hydrolase [Frondihabitans sp. PAMC 28766]AMM20201.1 hydrolase [Frondihabitans sp. PAMC 28766]
MGDDQKIYMPSAPLPTDRTGLLTAFEPGTRTLEKGSRIAPQFASLPVDIVFEKDVAVQLRDGVTVHVDVFRPVGTEPVPVIMAYSPYGKGQGTSASVMGIFGMVGLDNARVSGLEKFEGPDPAYWCARGYAICNPDIRGVVDSDGDSVLWDRQDGRDAYDIVEWLAEQSWCTGKVAMSGTSYLAATQWFAAAERPPHLAAINPWEGISDTYRDLVMRGGMPDTGFARQLRDNSFFGRNRKEDILAEADVHPLVDELWADKIPALENITVPAYVVASYSNTLHTAGTFRGWRRIASADKWLRVHNSQEWPDYYDEANRDDLRRFFDRFLLGVDNGWETTPRVRYSLLDLEGGDETGIPADAFPPAGVVSTKFYLDARTRTLALDAPTDDATAGYTVDANPDAVSFLARFDDETVLVGYPKAHLFVEADGADDLDLFVLVQKLDAHGTPLQAFTTPNQSAVAHDITDHGASILRYKGSDGRIRVSLRHLDQTLSTDDVPAHTFDRSEKLVPGQVAEVEIDLLPLGLRFHAGEQLRFVVSSRNLLGTMMPGIREYTGANAGRHIVHTGGARASYLQLPVRH